LGIEESGKIAGLAYFRRRRQGGIREVFKRRLNTKAVNVFSAGRGRFETWPRRAISDLTPADGSRPGPCGRFET
jgi:hypothetical protein